MKGTQQNARQYEDLFLYLSDRPCIREWLTWALIDNTAKHADEVAARESNEAAATEVETGMDPEPEFATNIMLS